MGEKSLEQQVLEKIREIEPDFQPVPCQLVGINGNALNVVFTVQRALVHHGYSRLTQLCFDLATSGDYDHVLAVAQIFTTPPDEPTGEGYHGRDDADRDDWDEDSEDEQEFWAEEADDEEDDEEDD